MAVNNAPMQQQQGGESSLVSVIGLQLKRMIPEFQRLNYSSEEADRFVRIVKNCVQNNPALMNASQKSLMSAIMSAAVLKLEPESFMGECHLVPYKGEVKLIIGYQGYIKLAKNSPNVQNVYSYPVYQNEIDQERFTVEYGSSPKVTHKPILATSERGAFAGVYAICMYKDGSFSCEYMTKEDVDLVKKEAVKNKKDPNSMLLPWNSHYNEMARKTVIRKLAKYMPKEFRRLAAFDAAVEQGKDVNWTDEGDIVTVESETVESSGKENQFVNDPPQPSLLDQFVQDNNKGE